MFVKRFKRKCSVRGCKNTSNVYLVSKRREMGGTIGICTDCLKEATESIKGYTEPIKVVREDAPLFPHPELNKDAYTIDENVESKEIIEDAVADESVTDVVAKIDADEEIKRTRKKRRTSGE